MKILLAVFASFLLLSSAALADDDGLPFIVPGKNYIVRMPGAQATVISVVEHAKDGWYTVKYATQSSRIFWLNLNAAMSIEEGADRVPGIKLPEGKVPSVSAGGQ